MATTHRIIRDLVAEGLLERHGSRYVIGTALWERGELAGISLHFRETTLPYLLTLYEATRENVHLAVREGLDALYVARLVGPHSVPTISRMGGRLPLHTTGVGRALLAFQSDAFLEEFFSHPLAQPTAYSLTTEKAVRTELEHTKTHRLQPHQPGDDSGKHLAGGADLRRRRSAVRRGGTRDSLGQIRPASQRVTAQGRGKRHREGAGRTTRFSLTRDFTDRDSTER